jgi:hypothetical protein
MTSGAGHDANRARYKPVIMPQSAALEVILVSPAHFGVAPQVCDYLNNK